MPSDSLVLEFVAALRLGAITITGADGSVTIATQPAGEPPAGADVMVLWCGPHGCAQLAVDLVLEDAALNGTALPDGRCAITRDAAVQVVEFAARQAGGRVYTDAETMARAAAAVERIVATFDQQLKAGELRDLNKRYRAHRLALAAEGRRAPPYNGWLAAYRIVLVREMAAAIGLAGPA